MSAIAIDRRSADAHRADERYVSDVALLVHCVLANHRPSEHCHECATTAETSEGDER